MINKKHLSERLVFCIWLSFSLLKFQIGLDLAGRLDLETLEKHNSNFNAIWTQFDFFDILHHDLSTHITWFINSFPCTFQTWKESLFTFLKQGMSASIQRSDFFWHSHEKSSTKSESRSFGPLICMGFQ